MSTEIVSVDGNYGKVIAREDITLADGTIHKVVGIEFPDSNVEFVKEERVSWASYTAAVTVDDPGGADSVEDAACALIDWIRSPDTNDHQIWVDVTIDSDDTQKHQVSIEFNEAGRAVVRLSGTRKEND